MDNEKFQWDHTAGSHSLAGDYPVCSQTWGFSPVHHGCFQRSDNFELATEPRDVNCNYHSIFLSALESHGLKRYLGKTVRQSTMLKCCFCIFKGRNKPFFHQVNHFILLYLIHKAFLFQHHKGKLPKYCWYRNSRLHIIIPIHMAYASHPLLESNSTSYIWNLRSSLSGKQVPWEGILSSK